MRTLGYCSRIDFECFVENVILDLLSGTRQLTLQPQEFVKIELPPDAFAHVVNLLGGRILGVALSSKYVNVAILASQSLTYKGSESVRTTLNEKNLIMRTSHVTRSSSYPIHLVEYDPASVAQNDSLMWTAALRFPAVRPGSLLFSGRCLTGELQKTFL